MTKQQLLEQDAIGWASEDKLQAECYQWAHNTYAELRGTLFSVPNGGYRNKIEVMKMKATGLTSGVPDMLCVYGGKLTAIELKNGANGVLSREQKELHLIWAKNGHYVHVCRSAGDWINVIEKILSHAK